LVYEYVSNYCFSFIFAARCYAERGYMRQYVVNCASVRPSVYDVEV